MEIQPWQRIEPTIKTKIDRRDVILKTFLQPDGHKALFSTFLAEDSRAGGVIALTPKLEVIVAKQYRPGPEKVMFEIPGGGINSGEDPKDGVMRELREETGYTSGDVTLLGTSCRDAYTNGKWFYYLALNCMLSDNGQMLDDHEHVAVELMTIDAFIANAKSDMMTDPAAVLMAYDRLKQLQDAT